MELNFNNLNTEEFIKKQMESSVAVEREYINRLIATSLIAEENACADKKSLTAEEVTERDKKVAANLVYISSKLLIQNLNLSYLLRGDLLKESESPVNAVFFLKEIASESTRLLSPIKREIQFVSEHEESPIVIDRKAFATAIMNLLQNALMYSPHGSAIIVKVENKDGFVCVSVTNLNSEKLYDNSDSNSELGIPLCMKIADKYNGKLEYNQVDGNKTEVKISLPLCEGDSSEYDYGGVDFLTETSEYFAQRFQPVNLFMSAVLYENGAVDYGVC
ncbi:MAG: HAMP domain-containing histidine kinase [Oscillospiraceae bacterium]|nr:HAMP domain-containing histidine kinase [Oscillospiraceae bacterium]